MHGVGTAGRLRRMESGRKEAAYISSRQERDILLPSPDLAEAGLMGCV